MSTSFNFGFNINDNADPWGRNTGLDADDHASRVGRSPTGNGNQVSDSNPVSIVDAKVDMVCNHVRKQIRIMTREVRKAAYIDLMPSAAELLKKTGGANAGNLLHGSDVPKKTSTFTVNVLQFREAPEGFQGSIGILDIDEVFGCTAWSLNKTNFKAVMALMGDNTDKWKGKLKLQVIQVRNPSTGTYGASLAVAR